MCVSVMHTHTHTHTHTCHQGENCSVAASRELYEEMGINLGPHLTLVRTLEEVHHYLTPPGSWLHKQVLNLNSKP